MKKSASQTILIYYITRAFVGLRFIIPIWVTFFLHRITFGQMAVLEVAAGIIGIILEFPSGVFADVVGRRISVSLGFIIKGIGYLIIAFSGRFELILLGTGIENVGNSFVSGAEDALIYDTLKQSKQLNRYAQVKANESIIYRLFLIISIASGGFIYKIKDILPYLLTGFGTLIAGLFYIFTKEPHIDSVKFNVTNYVKKFKEGLWESFKTPVIKNVSIYYVLVFSLSLLLAGYFELSVVTAVGFSEKESSAIFAGLTIITIVTASLATKIKKNLSSKQINFLLPLIPGLFLLLTLRNKYIVLLVLIVENAVLPFRFIFTSEFYNKFISSHVRASAISTLTMLVSGVYMFIIYIISTFVKFDQITISFNIIGGFLIITALWAKLMLPKHTKSTTI